jgi:hypothetical protein
MLPVAAMYYVGLRPQILTAKGESHVIYLSYLRFIADKNLNFIILSNKFHFSEHYLYFNFQFLFMYNVFLKPLS